MLGLDETGFMRFLWRGMWWINRVSASVGFDDLRVAVVRVDPTRNQTIVAFQRCQ